MELRAVVDVAESIETLNIDTVSQDRLGLFPKLERGLEENYEESDEVMTIDSEFVDRVMRLYFKDIEEDIGILHDRLLLGKLYDEFYEDNDNLNDFERYTRQVEFETLLKEKLLKRLLLNGLSLETDLAENIVPGEERGFERHHVNFIHRLIPRRASRPHAEVQDTPNIDNVDKEYLDQYRVSNEPVGDHYTTQRKLKSRHLQMIGFSSTIGVGLFLNSGKLFEIAGPLGCLLGYIIGGIIVLCTMLNFCEMVTLIPLSDGISGVTSRFVDDAFGFSLGLCYWISFGLGLPTEIIAGTIMLSYYNLLDVPDGNSTIGWIFMFLVLVVFINMMDVRFYAEFEFYLNIVKILFTALILIFLIVSNRGGAGPDHEFVGFKYWDSSKSRGQLTYGPFRPTFDLKDEGTGSNEGIGGNLGNFLSVITATLISCYSYNGTEIPCIVAGEVVNPRKALKSASKQAFWRIAFFYILSVFIIGLNIYSGDPRLLRYMTNKSGLETGVDITQDNLINEIGGSTCYHSNIWDNRSNGNQSPWVLAIQYTNNCSLSGVLNGFIIVFAISTSSSHLYVSSRSLYAMAVQGKAPSVLKRCWKNGVPYAAVMTTALFGLLSFLALNEHDLDIFQIFINLISTSLILTWFGINLAYVRFYHALKLRSDITSRNDPRYPYKAPFQPFLAYLGLIGSFTILLLMGYVTFLKHYWSVEFFLTSYGMWVLFSVSYVLYKIVRNVKTPKLYNIDLDTGRVELDLA